ncbi:MAG TPA: TetR/AcrR family transcriptional regulator [Actinospica sp.]|jgi:AcrR family transcriptional regulator|nr:TetR/AcrR family transcriptional regulator [Actinospica sp.]
MTGTTSAPTGGRVNQKKRTRDAIVRAAAERMATGREVTMPEIARAALVSEATAYRYFPDLASLLQEAMADQLPEPAAVLAAVTDSADPAERVAAATEYLLRHVVEREGAVRAMIAATVVRPGTAATRPGLRFSLIDAALAPLEDLLGAADPAAFDRLKLGLSVIVSAEALFSLTDLQGLDTDAAIAGLVQTAAALTRAAAAGQPNAR